MIIKEGLIVKSAGIPTQADLEAIASFTRRPFSPEELYVFSVALCDNEIDRDYERFSLNALKRLAALYIGKTGIFDHSMKGSDQTARIFSCKVEQVPGRNTQAGEPYTRLTAQAYLPRTAKNQELILELDSGIKKEVSVGCAVAKATCSVCGADLRQGECVHRKGRPYPGHDCPAHVVLDEPTDAYEWSFVAVPAQKEAGVIKHYKPGQAGSSPAEQGEEQMDSVQKMLETAGEELTLTKAQAQTLRETMKALQSRAADGEAYRADLQNEVLRLCALSPFGLPAGTMRGLAGRMTLAELKAFRAAFEKQAASALPLQPQLAPQRKSEPIHNDEFKI